MRPWLAVAAVAAVAAMLATAAGAQIVATSPAAEKIAPPASVEFDVLESNEKMFVFDEQQCVTLDRNVAVDITLPGTYDESSDLTNAGVVPAGTKVSSHFMHVDKVGSMAGPQPYRIELEGTATTDADILGIAMLQNSLDGSDFLGAPGTAYPTGDFGRRLNLDNQNDFIIEQVDVRTVVLHAQVGQHADQVRVISKCPESDLRVTKEDSPDPVEVDQELTYTLTVSNAGPETAKNVVLTDTLPASVTFVSADAPCAHAAGVVTCNLGDLANGATVQKQIVVKPTQEGEIVNNTCVSTDTPDPNSANNCDSEPTIVKAPPKADLWVKKWDKDDPVKIGQTVEYKLMVRNEGPNTAQNVVVTDTLPASVTFLSADAPCTYAAGAVTCNLGDLAAGSTVYKTIRVKPNEAGQIVNTVCVSSATPDPISTNNCDSETTTVTKPKCKILGLGKVGKYQAFAFAVANWGDFDGGVYYVDTKAKKTLKSFNITSVWNDNDSAIIKGTGKVNNTTTVAFTIEVADLPGPDSFSISWPGYSASGPVWAGGVEIVCFEEHHHHCW